jgi:glycosyltransferase involved in cell wall biosynthesis
MELSHGLATHGIEIILAALGGRPSAAQRAMATCIPNLVLLCSDYRLEWMPDPWRDIEESGRWLLRIADDYSPDVVHLNSFAYGAVPFRVPVVVTAHSCVFSWWQAVHQQEPPAEWDRYRALVANSLRHATAVTAPSEQMAAALERHYSYPRSGSEVIANGRSPWLFHSASKEPFILTAGRLRDEAKNVSSLMKLAPSLSWPIYAAGDYDGPGALGMLSQEELAGWYSRAAVYALPARYEPFGLTILEAALSGCALVLGDIPTLRHLWSNAALFVPPDNSSALQRALESLMFDRNLRWNLARNAARRALRFTPDAMVRRYLNLYRSSVRSQALCAS